MQFSLFLLEILEAKSYDGAHISLASWGALRSRASNTGQADEQEINMCIVSCWGLWSLMETGTLTCITILDLQTAVLKSVWKYRLISDQINKKTDIDWSQEICQLENGQSKNTSQLHLWESPVCRRFSSSSVGSESSIKCYIKKCLFPLDSTQPECLNPNPSPLQVCTLSCQGISLALFVTVIQKDISLFQTPPVFWHWVLISPDSIHLFCLIGVC